jgi:hypothetical protein
MRDEGRSVHDLPMTFADRTAALLCSKKALPETRTTSGRWRFRFRRRARRQVPFIWRWQKRLMRVLVSAEMVRPQERIQFRTACDLAGNRCASRRNRHRRPRAELIQNRFRFGIAPDARSRRVAAAPHSRRLRGGFRHADAMARVR